MQPAINIPAPLEHRFTGAAGNRLVADRRGSLAARPVLLAHGGGQTRHAWRGTADRLAERGWCAFTIDQRGHGDSDWIDGGEYEFLHYAEDLVLVAEEITRMCGRRPVAIGASLGGFAAMLAEGGSERRIFEALVLVDITPTVDPSGVEKILGFMAAHVERGFASLDEAADAIAAYLPHRKRPRDLAGLSKNLKPGEDGRFRWHWDPRFLDGRYPLGGHHQAHRERNIAAACALSLPVLLVRGGRSELVSEEDARYFLELVPHARFVDVSEAGHMVAGDRNDAFTDAVIEFLKQI